MFIIVQSVETACILKPMFLLVWKGVKNLTAQAPCRVACILINKIAFIIHSPINEEAIEQRR